jgi:hypothetical protein
VFLEAAFILLEFPSPSTRIFIGSHSLPPLWFAVSVLQSFEMILFRVAIHLVSFCTSLMQVGAFILVLDSMPRWLMMKPSSFLESTPKTHLFGLSFHRYSRRDAKVYSRSAMSVSEFRVLTTTSST